MTSYCAHGTTVKTLSNTVRFVALQSRNERTRARVTTIYNDFFADLTTMGYHAAGTYYAVTTENCFYRERRFIITINNALSVDICWPVTSHYLLIWPGMLDVCGPGYAECICMTNFRHRHETSSTYAANSASKTCNNKLKLCILFQIVWYSWWKLEINIVFGSIFFDYKKKWY